MGICKTKASQADLWKFTDIPVYSDISRNIQPGIIRIIQAYLERCVSWHIQNPGIFRTLSNLERTRVVFRILTERFVKIVNMLYEINIMNLFNTSVILTPIIFTQCKKVTRDLGPWILICPEKVGILNKYWSVLKQKRLKTVRRLNWNKKQSLRGEVFHKKMFLKFSENSQENLCAGVKTVWYKQFPVNFAEFSRTYVNACVKSRMF